MSCPERGIEGDRDRAKSEAGGRRVEDAFDLGKDMGEVISWELKENGHYTAIKMTLPCCGREETASQFANFKIKLGGGKGGRKEKCKVSFRGSLLPQ